MGHFTGEYHKFFRELSANNYREWFHENKKRYEQHVKKPFYQFLEDVISEVKKDDPKVDLEPKNAVFRINRDIRFSKDKSPYKLHMAGVVSRGGRKSMEVPGIYIQLGAAGIMIAGGAYKPDKQRLEQIRTAILEDPKRFRKILSNKTFNEVCGGMSEGEMNKILRPPFKEHVENIPELLNKQYFYTKHYEDPSLMESEDLLSFIMAHYHASKPFNQFLMKAMEFD